MPPFVRFGWFLCTFVLFTSAVTLLSATTSNSLFPPDVAKRLDTDIENIIRQNNLPSAAVGIFTTRRGFLPVIFQQLANLPNELGGPDVGLGHFLNGSQKS